MNKAITDGLVFMPPAFAEGLAQGRARAAMLWADADWRQMGLDAAILAPRPRYAMSRLTAMMAKAAGAQAFARNGFNPERGDEAGASPSSARAKTRLLPS